MNHHPHYLRQSASPAMPSFSLPVPFHPIPSTKPECRSPSPLAEVDGMTSSSLCRRQRDAVGCNPRFQDTTGITLTIRCHNFIESTTLDYAISSHRVRQQS